MFKPGTTFGIIALLLGGIADYFNGKQMEAEAREIVREELERHGISQNDN